MPSDYNDFGSRGVSSAAYNPEEFFLTIVATGQDGFQKFTLNHPCDLVVRLSTPAGVRLELRVDKTVHSHDELSAETHDAFVMAHYPVPANTLVKLSWSSVV